jgi:hypothetical protein
MRAEGGRIHFAHALDAAGGREFQENKITPAEARRRIADHETLLTLSSFMNLKPSVVGG